MDALTLIGTPENLPDPFLIALVMRARVRYRLECWSFKGYFCPACGEPVEYAEGEDKALSPCLRPHFRLTTTRTPEGLYVTRSCVLVPPGAR